MIRKDHIITTLTELTQRSRSLQYPMTSGDVHERFERWWYDMVFFLEEIDRTWHTTFALRLNKSIFLPTDTIKARTDVSACQSEHEKACHYQHDAFWAGLDEVRQILASTQCWFEQHGDQEHPLFQIAIDDHDIVMKELLPLLEKISPPQENMFLAETIKCCYIGAWRAAVVMIWNLTMFHLHEYIFHHKLHQMNPYLKTVTKKQTKLDNIDKREDFLEIMDDEFISFCRAIHAINKNQCKCLEKNLGIRNMYAHPSTMHMSRVQAAAVIEDLVTNILFTI